MRPKRERNLLDYSSDADNEWWTMADLNEWDKCRTAARAVLGGSEHER